MIALMQATPRYLSDIYSMILALAGHVGILDIIKLSEQELGKLLFSEKPDHFVIMALRDEQLAGMVLYNFNHNNVCFNVVKGIYIEMFYVAPEFRKQGVGHALMRYIAKEALSNSCSRVEWWVAANNHLAKNFYQKYEPLILDKLHIYKCDKIALDKLITKNPCP